MIVDIIIIVVIVLAALIGYFRGLTVSLVNIFSFIVAIMLATMLCKPFGNFLIENTKVDDNIKQAIKENIPINQTEFKLNTENSNLPENFVDYINQLGQSVTVLKDDTIEKFAFDITKDIIYAISFLIIYVIVKILLIVVKILSKIITKLPVIHQIDKVGGVISGIIEGLIVTYSALAIIFIISPILSQTKILNNINSSHIGKFMYNNNVIANKVLANQK